MSFPLSVNTLSGEIIVVPWRSSYCSTSILLELLERANPAFYPGFTTVVHIDPATNEPYKEFTPFTEESLVFAVVTPPTVYVRTSYATRHFAVYNVRWYAGDSVRYQLDLTITEKRISFHDPLRKETFASATTIEEAAVALKPCYREAFLQTWATGLLNQTFPKDDAWDDYYNDAYEEAHYDDDRF